MEFVASVLSNQTLGYTLDSGEENILLSHHQFRNIGPEALESFMFEHPNTCLLFLTTDHMLDRCVGIHRLTNLIIEVNRDLPSGFRVINL
jgi:hypothetical protein